MKKDYQVYKRHHNGRFIGWEIGYKTEQKKGKLMIERLVPVATFYNPLAKKRAKTLFEILKFDQE